MKSVFQALLKAKDNQIKKIRFLYKGLIATADKFISDKNNYSRIYIMIFLKF